MDKSFAYKLISKFGINISSDEYSNITFFGAFKKTIANFWKSLLLKYCMYSVILAPLNYRLIRPYLWKKLGCKVGKKVFIGYGVWFDFHYSDLIEIGDNVHITNMCLLLCHQRDISNYLVGDNAANLPYLKEKIIIERGVMIGMNSTIMPGAKIGEGSIIGANSLVIGDIPPWSIAAGNPAKVIRNIRSK